MSKNNVNSSEIKSVEDLIDDGYELVFWDDQFGILYNDEFGNGSLTAALDLLDVAISGVLDMPVAFTDADFNKIIGKHIKRLESLKR